MADLDCTFSFIQETWATLAAMPSIRSFFSKLQLKVLFGTPVPVRLQERTSESFGVASGLALVTSGAASSIDVSAF